MTKSIRVTDEVHSMIEAHKHDDETFSEAIERLIGGPSLRELAGILSDDEADTFREAIEESHADHDEELRRRFE
ncbi:antitoxin VapB family protein [Haladaptatus sp. T7]|uniref:antitoxin VapB family protein n=1 Tax=Haladaptatus sp. T7 TaxID=2029368 RepID=UPI0021A259D8|nr:antitoxin VapB family protein [Haladaptatus sp. T7]GKZ12328.1 hypothetical protein HAL_02090 [Haladaptatus sp. T7]